MGCLAHVDPYVLGIGRLIPKFSHQKLVGQYFASMLPAFRVWQLLERKIE
jgi:hypothetical protein